jgi:hypothetical protein
MGTNDIKKLLTASSIGPKSWPPSVSDIAYNVYAVSDSSIAETIFLTTKNWDATSPSGLQANAVPYGDKGFVVFRKGGDGAIYTARQATNQISFFGSSTNKVQ